MATPQGNFAAYKELEYRKDDRDNTVDFISLGIDRLIKEGKGSDAAKLKLAQDQGKTYYDAIKDIKVEPIQTVSMFQDFDNKAFNETFDAVAEAKRVTQDPSVPNSVKQQLSQKALEKQKGYLELKTFLGDPAQVKLFSDKLNTDTSKIWRGDEGLKIMRAVKANAVTYGFDVNGRPTVKFLDPDSNETIEKNFNEATQAVLNPYTEELVNKKDGLIDQMRSEALTMTIENENGIGGNRTTKSLKFNPEAAKKSFDTRFGDYNLNNDDVYLKQFSYDVLNNRTIQSKEDWDKVKQAYVDRMDGFVKEEKSTVDKYTAAQLQGQKADVENTKARTAKTKKSMQENIEPIVANENTTFVKQYNSTGDYIGYSEVKGSTVVIPGTQNTFTAVPFTAKDGTTYNKYFIGGLSKNSRTASVEVKDPLSTIKSYGKNTDAVTVLNRAINGASNLTPISIGNPIKINKKGSAIDLDIQETQIAPKAKASTRDNMKDFMNALAPENN